MAFADDAVLLWKVAMYNVTMHNVCTWAGDQNHCTRQKIQLGSVAKLRELYYIISYRGVMTKNLKPAIILAWCDFCPQALGGKDKVAYQLR